MCKIKRKISQYGSVLYFIYIFFIIIILDYIHICCFSLSFISIFYSTLFVFLYCRKSYLVNPSYVIKFKIRTKKMRWDDRNHRHYLPGQRKTKIMNIVKTWVLKNQKTNIFQICSYLGIHSIKSISFYYLPNNLRTCFRSDFWIVHFLYVSVAPKSQICLGLQPPYHKEVKRTKYFHFFPQNYPKCEGKV